MLAGLIPRARIVWAARVEMTMVPRGNKPATADSLTPDKAGGGSCLPPRLCASPAAEAQGQWRGPGDCFGAQRPEGPKDHRGAIDAEGGRSKLRASGRQP